MKEDLKREVLKSEQNAKVKYLKRLYHRRRRRREGKYVLEGFRIIKEALEAGVSVDLLFMTPEYAAGSEGEELLRMLESSGNDLRSGREGEQLIHLIGGRLLKKLADTETPQGVIAVVEEPRADLQGLIEKGELLLVLDRLQDPGNMGTIIRTAAAAGVDGILALKGCVDIYNLKVLRSTMGAIFNIPLVQDLSLQDFLGLLAGEAFRFTVAATALEESVDYTLPEYKRPLMLVIGNEGSGVCRDILALSSYNVRIPLYGQIESLNAAVACGVILYKIVEKNRKLT